jgi:DNA processing protein
MVSELRERAALVALLQQPGARWHEITLDVLDAESAIDVLRRRLGLEDTLFPETRAVESAINAAAEQIHSWNGAGIGVHAFFDDDYPEQLRGIHQMPPILFSRGVPAVDHRAIAVVGTRQASPHGLKIATAVASELARDGVTVVSGLAKGIDTAAHQAALSRGGRTVAVIGTGISRAYPRENAGLQERIAREGLVISQFWPDAPPSRQSFPMRNAVMSGYSAATVVVEAPAKSGARIQARLALAHGRPVIMPRELLQNDWAREYAERPGVHVVGGVDEILMVTNKVITELNTEPDALPEAPRFAWA